MLVAPYVAVETYLGTISGVAETRTENEYEGWENEDE